MFEQSKIVLGSFSWLSDLIISFHTLGTASINWTHLKCSRSVREYLLLNFFQGIIPFSLNMSETCSTPFDEKVFIMKDLLEIFMNLLSHKHSDITSEALLDRYLANCIQC